MTENNQNQGSKLVYEIGYLFDAKLSEDQAAAKAASLRDRVSQDAGEVIAEGAPKSRQLAYTITNKREGKRKDHNKAYFGWIKFDTKKDLLTAIEKELKADDEVVRYLLIKTVREDTMAHVTDEVEGEVDETLDTDEGVDDEALDTEAESEAEREEIVL